MHAEALWILHRELTRSKETALNWWMAEEAMNR